MNTTISTIEQLRTHGVSEPPHKSLRYRLGAAALSGCLALSLCPGIALAAPFAGGEGGPEQAGGPSATQQFGGDFGQQGPGGDSGQQGPDGGMQGDWGSDDAAGDFEPAQDDGLEGDRGETATPGTNGPANGQAPGASQPGDGEAGANAPAQPGNGAGTPAQPGANGQAGPGGQAQPSTSGQPGAAGGEQGSPDANQLNGGQGANQPGMGNAPGNGQGGAQPGNQPGMGDAPGGNQLGMFGMQFMNDQFGGKVRDILSNAFGLGMPGMQGGFGPFMADVMGAMPGQMQRTGQLGQFGDPQNAPELPEGAMNTQQVIDSIRDIVEKYGAEALESADFSDEAFTSELAAYAEKANATRLAQFKEGASGTSSANKDAGAMPADGNGTQPEATDGEKSLSDYNLSDETLNKLVNLLTKGSGDNA